MTDSEKIYIQKSEQAFDSQLILSGSKSISNRVLLISALSGKTSRIQNISLSDDTKLLQASLANLQASEFDLGHAGTSFRFLTAFFAIQKGTQILTGSQRMKERPIGPLVEALQTIGADIEYLENEGYPPLRIGPYDKQTSNTVNISAEISSQFISALCMIAPVLEYGLTIELKGKLVSRPYLDMTLNLMQEFGVHHESQSNEIRIPKQDYNVKDFTVESDWSSASYMIALVALIKGARLKLQYLNENSLQGDRKILDLYTKLGVNYSFNSSTLILEQSDTDISSLEYDFSDQPDMFQTVAVTCALKGIDFSGKGLDNLVIKETNRIKAVEEQLKKLGLKITTNLSEEWQYVQTGQVNAGVHEFETYNDHRMAMSMSLIASQQSLTILNPMVVNKSYPEYWKHFSLLGYKLKKA